MLTKRAHDHRVAVPRVCWPILTASMLALTAPHSGSAQAPDVRNDTLIAPSVKPVDDQWYPEGLLRIRRKRYSIFLGATFTQFVNANARRRFGAGTLSPAVELYRPQHGGFSPVLEFNDTRIASDDATARIIAVTAGLRYRPVDAQPARWLVPYVSIGAGPRWVRTPGTARTTRFSGGSQVGLELVRTVRLTVRYDALPGVRGHQLSTMAFGIAGRLPPYRAHARHAASDASAAPCAGTRCAR